MSIYADIAEILDGIEPINKQQENTIVILDEFCQEVEKGDPDAKRQFKTYFNDLVPANEEQRESIGLIADLIEL